MSIQQLMYQIYASDLTDEQCRRMLIYITGWLGDHERVYDIEDVKKGFEFALQFALKIEEMKYESVNP